MARKARWKTGDGSEEDSRSGHGNGRYKEYQDIADESELSDDEFESATSSPWPEEIGLDNIDSENYDRYSLYNIKPTPSR